MMSSLIDDIIKISEEGGGETVGKETSVYLPGYAFKFSLAKIDSFSSNSRINYIG